MEFIVTHPGVPSWLKSNINSMCRCGTPIAVSDNLRRMYCPNPRCRVHMGAKISELADKFKIKGVGNEVGTALVQHHNLESHLDILPIWFSEKPEVELWEVGQCCQIDGFNKKWKELVGNCLSMEEMYINNPVPGTIMQYRDFICDAQRYFKIKKPDTFKMLVYIWITGSIGAFSNRKDYVASLNEEFKGYIKIVDNDKKVAGTEFLIKEFGTRDHSKTEKAMSCGIPIITPEEFRLRLLSVRTYMIEKGDSPK